MRTLPRGFCALALSCAATCCAMEVSTGFLIGPRHDSRAFYVRASSSANWEKTYSGAEFRRQAQGKLFGVRLPQALLGGAPDRSAAERTESALAAALGELRRHGVLLVGVSLQGADHSAFVADGAIKADWLARLDRVVEAADRLGMLVEVTCFHPGQDEQFDAPAGMLAAARHLSAHLIRRARRNVLLTFAGEWSGGGWDHDAFMTQGHVQLIDAAREQFQELHTDYALPIAVSSGVRLAAAAPLSQAADILMLRPNGSPREPRKLDRPELLVDPAATGADALERDLAALSAAFVSAAGWIYEPALEGGLPASLAPDAPGGAGARQLRAVLERIAALTLARPPSAAGGSTAGSTARK